MVDGIDIYPTLLYMLLDSSLRNFCTANHVHVHELKSIFFIYSISSQTYKITRSKLATSNTINYIDELFTD